MHSIQLEGSTVKEGIGCKELFTAQTLSKEEAPGSGFLFFLVLV